MCCVTRAHTCAAPCKDPFTFPLSVRTFQLNFDPQKSHGWPLGGGRNKLSARAPPPPRALLTLAVEILRKHLLRKIRPIIHSCSYFPRSTDPKLRIGSALTHGTTSGCSRASVCSLVDHFVCLLAWNGCALFNFLTAESKSTQ